jgi:hypothetical protein
LDVIDRTRHFHAIFGKRRIAIDKPLARAVCFPARQICNYSLRLYACVHTNQSASTIAKRDIRVA